jgi:starvation-inducible outer membrane lipoprotein
MIRAALKSLLAVTFAFTLSGCLTQRTVSEGGHTVSQEYVIKRPLKEAVRNSQ